MSTLAGRLPKGRGEPRGNRQGTAQSARPARASAIAPPPVPDRAGGEVACGPGISPPFAVDQPNDALRGRRSDVSVVL
jgi:hypothetical protein